MVLIFRYLAKEIFITLVSLTAILMLIFMSNQFVRYLNRAASGQIPFTIIMKLMMIEVPNLTGLLLPLGFYIALLVAYGRLYAESEMTVLQACGYGLPQLIKHSFIMAIVVSGITMAISLWVSPMVATERTKLLRTTGVQTLIETIVPGRFRSAAHGRDVFYVESVDRANATAGNVFLARQLTKNNHLQWNILWAEKAFAQTEPQSHEDYLILQTGHEYEGIPGRANYQVADFSQAKIRLPHPVVAIDSDLRTAKTAQLWPLLNSNKHKAAELQWRLSIPLMVLTLTLVAVPLSRVNPRLGKFAKLLPAIVLYIVYANFIFIARDWLISGKLPTWLGMWWVHALVASIGLLLIWRSRKLG